MEREPDDQSAPWGRPTWQTVTLVVTALAGVATLVALILTLAGANRQRDRALDAQEHSYDVMILARTLAGTIARSEASLGRYVISGDRRLGQLYVDEWSRASAELDRLDRLTADSPDQQRRVDGLRVAYGDRDRELSLIALSTSYKKNGQAVGLWYRARQAPSLGRIDTMLEAIIDRERTLLRARSAAATLGVDHASRIAGVLALVGALLVLLGIVLGWLMVQAMRERLAARADADAAQARADELARAVAEATDELRVQEAKLRQVQKMEAVGQLTGGIAHDFNNMLAVVLGGLELARRHVGDAAAAARHLDSAREGAERAAALTRRLLAFSREEALRPEPIGPGALVKGMSELLDRTLGDAITVVVRDAAPGRRVRADRVQLENAVLNLAVNARDAMAGRGTLTITTGTRRLSEHEVDRCAAGEYVTIAVRDTGAGMTPDIAERVFEPFFTTKEAGKGTGLGLSQIFALVRQLDGAVMLDTLPGRGTEVTLILPCDHGAPAMWENSVAAAAPPATPGDDLRILLVEDDPRVLAATTGALTELGHRAIPCPDPRQAAATLDARPGIDLILSDVLMPGLTGPEMIAGLPARFASLPVLFMTGFAGDTETDEFGDRPVLRKPFTLAALERAIGEAVAHAPQAPFASRIAAR